MAPATFGGGLSIGAAPPAVGNPEEGLNFGSIGQDGSRPAGPRLNGRQTRSTLGSFKTGPTLPMPDSGELKALPTNWAANRLETGYPSQHGSGFL